MGYCLLHQPAFNGGPEPLRGKPAEAGCKPVPANVLTAGIPYVYRGWQTYEKTTPLLGLDDAALDRLNPKANREESRR
jgi:hypothetical protein